MDSFGVNHKTQTGKVVEEFDCITIEVLKMEHLAIIQDPRYAMQSKANEQLAAAKERRRIERQKTNRFWKPVRFDILV